MKRSKKSVEQIISILKEADAGVAVADLCRKHVMSDASFYLWRKKYGGLEISDAVRLKALESENQKLKRIVADQVLEITALKDISSKKW